MPNNNPPDNHENVPAAQQPKRIAVVRAFIVRYAGFFVIGGVGVILITALTLIAHFAVTERSVRIAFVAQNVLNLLIFIAIVVQAFIYTKQWQIMDKATNAAELSAKAAQESARLMALAQRPDIVLDLKFGDLLVGQRIGMQFRAYNAGQVTAYNFGMHISADWKPAGFEGVLDYGKPKPEATEPIRPKAARFVHPQWFYPLQNHDFVNLANERVWLIVYGILWYEDGTGKRYQEPFCRRWDRGSPNDAVECPYSLREKMVEEIEQAETEVSEKSDPE